MPSHETLEAQLESVGYFPGILLKVIGVALGDQVPVASYVHADVAIGHSTIGRHLSVLVITPDRLIVGHADDHSENEFGPAAVAVSTEAIRLRDIRVIGLNHIYLTSDEEAGLEVPAVLRLVISWGAGQVMEIEPIECPDQGCETDHGYSGTVSNEDIALTVNADLAGIPAASALLEFARKLSAVVAAAGR
ncbi:MAG: DUF5998 family protein [Bifidobacteriaceae bacterium]|jgi:hypothetical protein|nr:DUF5998 family protein [Bifidobacteriaceae bacterium]